MSGIVPKEFRDEVAKLQILAASSILAIVGAIFIASAFDYVDNTNPTVTQANTIFVAIAGGASWFIFDAYKKIQEQKTAGKSGTTTGSGPPS